MVTSALLGLPLLFLNESLAAALPSHQSVSTQECLTDTYTQHPWLSSWSLPCLTSPFPWIGSQGRVLTPYLPDTIPRIALCLPCLVALDSGLPFPLSLDLVQAPVISCVDHCHFSSADLLSLDWMFFYPLSTLQLVFLKCILILPSSLLVLSWSAASRTPAACLDALPIPRALRVSRNT